MYRNNPLLEMSTRQLLKKRKLYTPEQWKKMMDSLQKIGKNKNSSVSGLHSAEEYGKRMLAGQKKRGQKLAKKYGRHLLITKDTARNANGHTWLDTKGNIDSIVYSKNPFIDKQELEYGLRSNLGSKAKDRLSRKDIRKTFLNQSNNKKNAKLTQANILAHEMDEYSLGLKHSKKLNVPLENLDSVVGIRNPYSNINSTDLQSIRGNHMPGVLSREAKRQHMINSLYGRDSTQFIKRDANQFATNNERYILNHPKTKEKANLLSNNKETVNKAIKDLRSKERQNNIIQLKKDISIYGYNPKTITLDELEKDYTKFNNRKFRKEYADRILKRKGLVPFIKDPHPDRNNFLDRFNKEGAPEGYINNPKYQDIKDKIYKRLDKRTSIIGQYMDYLETSKI